MRTLLLAQSVAPMNGAPIREGGVLIEEGTIRAVGAGAELERESRGSLDDVQRLGKVALLPGLINAHTHLELTGVGQLPRPASFVDWVLGLLKDLRGRDPFEEFLRQSCQLGIARSLESGVTTVADITGNPALTRPLVGRQLRGISFGEVLGMAGRAAQFGPRLQAALAPLPPGSKLRSGIEPHAPYSLDLALYGQCVKTARELAIPLATHLAETPDEAEFLARQTGPFARLWAALGDWNSGVSRFEGGPVRAMAAIGLLQLPALLAHVNYADDDELDLLARGRASVVVCPRTHDYFGHPPHRWREMLARGINVAVGTDSAASAPDLNLVEDLRLLHRQHPDVPAGDLWSLVTTRAARALGMENQIGDLSPGKKADFCIFPLDGDGDPLGQILESGAVCQGVWMDGTRLL